MSWLFSQVLKEEWGSEYGLDEILNPGPFKMFNRVLRTRLQGDHPSVSQKPGNYFST